MVTIALAHRQLRYLIVRWHFLGKWDFGSVIFIIIISTFVACVRIFLSYFPVQINHSVGSSVLVLRLLRIHYPALLRCFLFKR